jgi:hypothetical protein
MTESAAQSHARQVLYVNVLVLSYTAYVLISTDCLVSLLKMITWILLPFLVQVYILIGAHNLKNNDESEAYYTFVVRSTALTFCCSSVTSTSCLLLCILWLIAPDDLLLRQFCTGIVFLTHSGAFLVVVRRWIEIDVTVT